MRSTLILGSLLLVSCGSGRDSTPVDPAQPAHTLATLRALGALGAPSRASLALSATLPLHAAGALRLGQGDAWIEVTPRGLAEAKGATHPEGTVYANAAQDLDLVYVKEPNRVEELRLARTRAAAAMASWDVRLGPAIRALQIVDEQIEAVDRDGIVRVASERMWAVDARGLRRNLALELHGATVTARLDVEGLATPIAVDPAWVAATHPSEVGRVLAGITLLKSGKVLLTGGQSFTTGGRFKTAEVYDPATNKWAATATTMDHGRSGHTATWFGGTSTRVILIGGEAASTDSTAEIYDEATNSFSATIALPTTSSTSGPNGQRRNHAAVRLPTGEVMVVGGRADSFIHDNYFIAKDTSTPFVGLSSTRTMAIPRESLSAVVLADGRVVSIGGNMTGGSGSQPSKGGEIATYNPSTGAVTATVLPSMPVARVNAFGFVPAAGPMKDLPCFLGGSITAPSADTVLVPSQGGLCFDVAAWTGGATAAAWLPLPLMSTPRTLPAAGLIAADHLFMAGGVPTVGIAGTALASAEVLDLVKMTWKSAGAMSEPRAAPSAIPLADGSMLVSGGVQGITEGFLTLATKTERFTLQAKGAACDADGQCLSGFCVDKVCCDKACAGQCEACDVAGSVGTCATVTGAPHGTRAACAGKPEDHPTCAATCNGTDPAICHVAPKDTPCGTPACSAGVAIATGKCGGTAGTCDAIATKCGDYVCDATACKTSCTVKADCSNPAHFCESGKCIPQQASGSPCTRDEACATGNCVDGTCCDSKCDGQCQACDVPGQAGKCTAIKGKPHGTRKDCDKDGADACKSKSCDGTNTAACAATVGPCSNFACDDEAKACKKACTTNADCAAGFECDTTAHCIPRTSKCLSTREMQAADGTVTKCVAYTCLGGACQTRCTTTDDCLNGYACDDAKTCTATTAAPAADASSGGCSTGGRTSYGGLGLAALALLGATTRRRRR